MTSSLPGLLRMVAFVLTGATILVAFTLAGEVQAHNKAPLRPHVAMLTQAN